MCVPYKKINFDNWNLLSTLDKNQWEDSELVHVFSEGRGAIIVKNNELYTLGSADQDIMFKNADRTEPMKVENINIDNQIQCVATGYGHAVILDKKGRVHTFGFTKNKPKVTFHVSNGNVYTQITANNTEQSVVKNVRTLHLAQIVSIACGGLYTLALDVYKRIWFWGKLSDDEDDKHGNDIDPKCLPYPQNIQDIAAGSSFAACLDHDGKVYTWGTNTNGYLGHGGLGSIWKPTLVEALESYKVVQVECCALSILFLTSCGRVFITGRKDRVDLFLPIEVTFRCFITRIFGSRRHFIYGAQNKDGVIYRWEGQPKLSEPVRTNIQNPLEIFSTIGMPGVCTTTFIPYSIHTGNALAVEHATFIANIAQFYNSKIFSDIQITHSDGKLFAHKCILSAKSEFFNRLLTGDTFELNLWNHNALAVKTYIKYLYTGYLERVDDIKIIPEIYEFAKRDNKTGFMNSCIEQWTENLNKDNVIQMFLQASQFNEEKVLLKECAKIAIENINEIALTAEFKKLELHQVHALFEYGLNTGDKSE